MSSSPSSPPLPRASYSQEEILDIYALGRMWLETGQLRRAEVVMHGLNMVAPEFVPGWLGTAFVQGALGKIDAMREVARKVLRLEPESAEGMMFLVMAALTSHDVTTAGTFLGEIGDLIDQGKAKDPNLIRLFKMQMARYQGRAK